MIVRSRAPVRLSFGGGGTDIEPYASEHGGIVLSTTINQFAYCTVKPFKPSAYESDFAKAAKLRYLSPPVTVSHFSEAPAGSGLGGSSSLMVAIIKALRFYHGEAPNPHAIAKEAYNAERIELELKGGYQDQFAASYGGWNLMDFSEKGAKIVPLKPEADFLRELLASLILVDLGKSRISSNIISRQITSYEKQQPKVMETLNKIKDITRQMVVKVLAGDVKELGFLLSEEWMEKKKLDTKISNHVIEKFYTGMLLHGAIGGKLLGAGEGGHMLFLSDLSDREKLLEYVKSSGFRHVPFSFEPSGAIAWKI